MSSLVRFAKRRPMLFVGVVALAARLVFAVGSFLGNKEFLIPDEGQYLELAGTVASGRSAESWFPGYGQSLYDAMRVFLVPIRVLFDVFGTSRLVAQLWPVIFGVVTAVLAVRLAQQVLVPRRAVVVGLVVALLPSQVLWSSVVLRESLVWAGLLVVTLAAVEAARGAPSRTLAWLAVGGGGLLALAFLREQTMVVAAWAMGPAVLLASADHRWRRTVGALIVAGAVPLVAGFGLFGYDVVERAVPALGRIRTNLAAGADSAFTGTTIPARPVATTTPSPSPSPGPGEIALTTPSGQVVIIDKPPPGAPEQIALTAPNGLIVVVDKTDIGPNQTALVGVNGRVYVVGEETFSSSLSNIPNGAVATLLRPFVWESAHTLPLRFASVENGFWYLLYLLAAAGIVLGWRRLRFIASVPLVAAGLLAVSFVSQGNVGSAFRHRGQVLPLLAVIAAVGADELLGRRRAARRVDDAVPDDAPGMDGHALAVS